MRFFNSIYDAFMDYNNNECNDAYVECVITDSIKEYYKSDVVQMQLTKDSCICHYQFDDGDSGILSSVLIITKLAKAVEVYNIFKSENTVDFKIFNERKV